MRRSSHNPASLAVAMAIGFMSGRTTLAISQWKMWIGVEISELEQLL